MQGRVDARLLDFVVRCPLEEVSYLCQHFGAQNQHGHFQGCDRHFTYKGDRQCKMRPLFTFFKKADLKVLNPVKDETRSTY